MTSYTDSRRWSDKFLARQRTQLAEWFDVTLEAVVVTDDQTDRIDGVDVIIGGQVTVSLRTRRYGAYERFGRQPTIRLSTGHGGRSELDKIKHGGIHYMMLSYATQIASEDNDDDGLVVSTLLDLGPLAKAAQGGFAGVTVTEVDADRVHALAFDLATLMARYGACIVAQDVATTTTTETIVNAVGHNGLHHRTTETESVTRTTKAHDPELLKAARQRVRKPKQAALVNRAAR